MTEGDIKRTIQEYLELQRVSGVLYWDRLNSGSVLVRAGSKTYRLQLCREGTPDLMVITGKGLMFLEVKQEGKKPTKVQLDMHRELREHGAKVCVVHSLEEVIEVLS